MNNQNIIFNSITLVLSLFLSACSSSDDAPSIKQEVPTINTTEISNITSNSVQSGGMDIDSKEGNIIDKGICWSLDTDPTINDSKLSTGNGSDDFNITVEQLDGNTTYYLKSYATNETGTGYGNEQTFTTKEDVDAPCSPQNNSVVFDSSVRNLGSSTYISKGLFYGEYGLKSNSTEGDLNIEFSTPPKTGIYSISSDPFFMSSKECIVTGVFKIFGDPLSHRYTANAGANAFVYVKKTETGKYSMTFCNLSFASGSISFTFGGSNGNLTTM